MLTRPLSRRRFLAAVPSVAGVGYLSCRALAEPAAPSAKLRIGVIGVGGRGGDNLGSVAGESIAALCDIDDNQLKRAGSRFPDAKLFHDFREMLADPKGLDAVVISTADHTHAPAAVRAMRHGLHVYSEKPLGHTVFEARLMRETYLARRDKIATQMGTQIHATENYRRVVELVQAGAIGAVTHTHVWCNRFSSQNPIPQGETKAPPHIHWDLWLGPAPARPYQKGSMPGNLTWNRYWDFGNGILGDMGSHLIDLPYWALQLTAPTAVHALAPEPKPDIYPARLAVTWDHPARGAGPHQQACRITWYDGEAKPASLHDIDLRGYGIGALFVGETGKILADYGRVTVIPDPDKPQPKVQPARIPSSLGHHQEWLAACKGKPTQTLCNFDYSGRLIEHNLLGVVSHRAGNLKLACDAATGRTDSPAADAFLTKTYRPGWGYEVLS